MRALLFSARELRRLYVGNGLSTYKIAEKYGCDPKTAYRYLKLYRIPTRPRKKIELSERELTSLYTRDQKPLSKIAATYGYSASGILKKLKEYGIERRTLSETSTKHTKKDFSGSLEDKAYMIGFRIGDLGVRRRRNLIYVSSGTTKAAQSALIQQLFRFYGPVWLSKTNANKAVNISCALNDSFSFLLSKHKNIPMWITRSTRMFLSFLAGYTDAEGNFQISNGMGKFRIRSCDVGILRDIHHVLARRGIRAIFALERRAGKNKQGFKLSRDCWLIAVNEKNTLSQLLGSLLPLLRHEKRRRDAEQVFENITRRIAKKTEEKDTEII